VSKEAKAEGLLVPQALCSLSPFWSGTGFGGWGRNPRSHLLHQSPTVWRELEKRRQWNSLSPVPVLERNLEMEIYSFIPQMIMNSLQNAMVTLKTKMDTVPALMGFRVQQQ